MEWRQNPLPFIQSHSQDSISSRLSPVWTDALHKKLQVHQIMHLKPTKGYMDLNPFPWLWIWVYVVSYAMSKWYMDCTCIALFESGWLLKTLSHYMPHSTIHSHTHTARLSRYKLHGTVFYAFTHIHTQMNTLVGNVEFSVLPKDTLTREVAESNHRPSDW